MGGMKILFNRTPEIKKAVTVEVGKEVRKTTLLVEGGAKLRIQTGPKTGKRYGKHQASAPGEAPATDTGHLVNTVQSHFDHPLRGTVDVPAEYATALEFGSEDETLEARPFLKPSVDEQQDAFEKAVEDAVRRGSKK
jgi:hypothetical protein